MNQLCNNSPSNLQRFPLFETSASLKPQKNRETSLEFMAAALTKSSLHRIRRHDKVLQYLRARSISHATTYPASSQKNIGCKLHQYKWCSLLPHSVFRRTKDMLLSASSATSSRFCSTASSASPELGLIGWYLGMVKTRPILTKSITSSFIYTAADLSSQMIVGNILEEYDFLRTLRMAGYGMIILGPSLHYWFNFMSWVFPKRDLSSTIKKMVSGQTVYGPALTATFFSVNAGLQGESGSEIVARLKRDLVPTMVSGIMYWPICDFVTFKFIPVHLQPLVSNSFAYLWTIYMTYMASLAKVSSG